MWQTHLARIVGISLGLATGLVPLAGLGQSPDRPGTGEPRQPGVTSQPSAFVENEAGIRLDLLPAVDLAIGTDVTFRVSAREPGYLVVVNVDPAGKIRQVYPRADDMLRADADGAPSNRIDRNQPITIPDSRNSGVEPALRVAPPPGLAVAVAILCDQPVQLLDLPDVPPALAGRAEALVYLADATRALRLASAQPSSRSAKPKWSFNAKFYVVEPP